MGTNSWVIEQTGVHTITTLILSKKEEPRKPCEMTDEEIASVVDVCFKKYDTYTINLVIAEGFPEVFVGGICRDKDRRYK